MNQKVIFAFLSSMALLCANPAISNTVANGAESTNEVKTQDSSDKLPEFLKKAAKRWKVNEEDIVISVIPLDDVREKDGILDMSQTKPILSYQEDKVIEPASTAKLITTLAGLETLGARFRWFTEIYLGAEPNSKGVLKSPLYIRGGADPSLVIEDFKMQLDRLYQQGVRHIKGNIVLDRGYLNLPEENSSAFDGRGSRPYNIGPDALLLNYRNVSFEFIPNDDKKTAKVVMVPTMSGVTVPRTIRLNPKGGCGDWKNKIGFQSIKDKSGNVHFKFNGKLPIACGAKNFNVIPFGRDEYFERVFRAAWQERGGIWKGKVIEGSIPEGLDKKMVIVSKSLPEVVTLINKWSNNTMARHLFLTLGRANVIKEAQLNSNDDEIDYLSLRGATLEDARVALHDWFESRGIDDTNVYIDNGSGLSRVTHVTAKTMTDVLAAGWVGPYMSEYMASLPISGEDGTMAKRKVAVKYGRIKTGFLSDVRSIGGYIRSASGKKYAVYASVHGVKNMPGGIVFLDNVINWVYKNN